MTTGASMERAREHLTDISASFSLRAVHVPNGCIRFFSSGREEAMAAMTVRVLLDLGGLCFGIAALLDLFSAW
ncbi:MAG: hypothetical protein WBW81_07380 [Methylocella sp.]